MTENSRLKTIYGKPLVGKEITEPFLEEYKAFALERVGNVAVEEIQNEIKRSSWNRKPTKLINSFSYEVKNSSVQIHSDHPAAQYLNKGVKPHQMIYLEDAKKPIPIITEEGKVIFRTPSSQTMKDGSWQHPGIKGKHFLERGIDKAKEAVKEEIGTAYKELVLYILNGENK